MVKIDHMCHWGWRWGRNFVEHVSELFNGTILKPVCRIILLDIVN